MNTEDATMERININTVLLTIVLGISGWSLLEQNAQGKAQAAYAVRIDSQSVELANLSARLQSNDAAIQDLRLQIARMATR